MKLDLDNVRFFNYRCRKCDQIISIEQRFNPREPYVKGLMIANKYHKNCKCEIDDGEYVFADLISVSVEPLKDSIDIYYKSDLQKIENNEEKN